MKAWAFWDKMPCDNSFMRYQEMVYFFGYKTLRLFSYKVRWFPYIISAVSSNLTIWHMTYIIGPCLSSLCVVLSTTHKKMIKYFWYSSRIINHYVIISLSQIGKINRNLHSVLKVSIYSWAMVNLHGTLYLNSAAST